ncbi:MAG: hypothetical protein ACK4NP_11985 [Parvularculaceae bacterium]
MRASSRYAAFAAAWLAAAIVYSGAADARGSPQPAQALADIEISSIAVEVTADDSNFTVIDSRFDETATAGALLGVLGASINSGINAGEDDRKADRFRAGAAGVDLAGLLTRSAVETLAARRNPPAAGAKAEASHSLIIEIHNWGLIRASREDPRLRAFLNLSWKIADAKGKTVFEKKRENAVAPELRPLADHSDETLNADVEALAAKAGALIAYQIIYR